MSAYCTVAEVSSLGIKRDAYADATNDQIDREIASTSDLIDSYLGSRYTLPLIVFPEVIRECCAKLSACDLVDAGGRDPDPNGPDGMIDKIRKQWLDWLKMVAAGTVTPPGVIDSTPGATAGSSPGARILSSSSRGYSVRNTGQGRGPFQTD